MGATAGRLSVCVSNVCCMTGIFSEGAVLVAAAGAADAGSVVSSGSSKSLRGSSGPSAGIGVGTKRSAFFSSGLDLPSGDLTDFSLTLPSSLLPSGVEVD